MNRVQLLDLGTSILFCDCNLFIGAITVDISEINLYFSVWSPSVMYLPIVRELNNLLKVLVKAALWHTKNDFRHYFAS